MSYSTRKPDHIAQVKKSWREKALYGTENPSRKKRRSGRPNKWEPGTMRELGIFIRADVLEKIELLTEELQSRSDTRIYRADVVRMLISKGLEQYLHLLES